MVVKNSVKFENQLFMNILIISFSINGSMGDNFRMLAEDISSLANVRILTNYGISFNNIDSDKIKKIKFDRKRAIDFVNPFSFWKIYNIINDKRIDIIFICSPHPVNLFVFKFTKKKKIVTYVHDYILHSGVKGIDKIFLNEINRCSYKYSSRIIVASELLKNEIVRLKLFSDPMRIDVIYLGLLDNLKFSFQNVEEDIDVLFFGRIELYKGIDDLLEVCKMLPNYNFWILGKGDINRVYSKTIEIPRNCTRIDRYIPDKELAEYIQRAKIIIMPYKNATGSQVIPSVFYYSKPIVATNVGCFEEYIGNGIGGVIVHQGNYQEMAEAIKDLLDNSQKRAQMGKAGHDRLNLLFSKEQITQKYIDVFQSVRNENALD
jgi:glycosyltransferase involved in cell wall biosynthesis